MQKRAARLVQRSNPASPRQGIVRVVGNRILQMLGSVTIAGSQCLSLDWWRAFWEQFGKECEKNRRFVSLRGARGAVKRGARQREKQGH